MLDIDSHALAVGDAGPRIAVVVPVYRPDPRYLRVAVQSVLQQTIEDWELILVDDGSDDPAVSAMLDWADHDDRVTVVRLAANRGISGASNAALEHVSAPWIALLDHDDALEPTALAEVLDAAADSPGAEVVYTDRDAIDADGRGLVEETFRKPDWSPTLLLGNMYLAHLTVVRTDAVRAVGGFRSEFDGAQDHDLVLRIAERGRPVVHVPRVLYHWRQSPQSTALDAQAKPYAAERGLAAVADHLTRTGRAATVRHGALPGTYQLDLEPRPCLVSLVIPTRGGSGRVHGGQRVFAVAAVRSVLAHRYVCDVEIVVVHDEGADSGYLGTLRSMAGDRLRVIEVSGPFNFSAKVNRGIEVARGEVIVLLNDDVEVITPRWLDQLVAYAQDPGVGAVGAKLIFEDGTIQHAGHFYAWGNAGHASAGRPGDFPGSFGADLVDREVSGVTAAALAQRRDVWVRLGGLDETLPNNFNDVDYCLRIRAKGYRIVQANSVRLFHYESKTRHPRVHAWEALRIRDRLGDAADEMDPYTPVPLASLDRSLREWVRVSTIVLRTEGGRSFVQKARRRLSRS